MGIKIVNKGGKIKAKGNPLGSNIGYFFAVLFLIAGFIMMFSHILGATILFIIGIIIVSASAHHSKEARIKKLKEAGYTPLAGGNKINKKTGQSGYRIINFFWELDYFVLGLMTFILTLIAIGWIIAVYYTLLHG